MATADELTQRETELARNQLAWKNTKADLERECVNIKGQIEALLPKLEKLKADCQDEQNRKIELTQRQKDLQQQIAAAHDTLKVAAGKVVAANKELAVIDKLVSSRKEGIDAEISQYRQLKQAESDETLADAQDALKQAENAVEDVETLLTNTQSKLEDYQTALEHALEAVEEHNRELARLQQKEKDLKGRIEPLQSVVDGLEEQIRLKNEEVAEATKKLEDFKTYEAKAWKALRAKDQSLQEQVTELERLERLAINRGSFLPER